MSGDPATLMGIVPIVVAVLQTTFTSWAAPATVSFTVKRNSSLRSLMIPPLGTSSSVVENGPNVEVMGWPACRVMVVFGGRPGITKS